MAGQTITGAVVAINTVVAISSATPLAALPIILAVAVSMFADVPEFHVEHIALAEWAHVVLVAPATANIIGKAANAICST